MQKKAPRLENPGNSLQVLEDIMRRVQKETCRHCIPLFKMTWIRVDLCKVTRHHGEVGRLRDPSRLHIRDSDPRCDILGPLMVRKTMDPGVDLELLFPRSPKMEVTE